VDDVASRFGLCFAEQLRACADLLAQNSDCSARVAARVGATSPVRTRVPPPAAASRYRRRCCRRRRLVRVTRQAAAARAELL